MHSFGCKGLGGMGHRWVGRGTSIFAFLLVLILLGNNNVSAEQSCIRVGPTEKCLAEVPRTSLGLIYSYQENPEWCWAASVSMVFRYYGYDVPQSQIVREAYGSTFNWSANGETITKSLNKEWVDRNGQRFRVKASVFDALSGVFDIDHNTAISDLKNGRPLILGTHSHAVVASAIEYLQAPLSEPQVIRIGVLDPWPGSAPARSLSIGELPPTFLASVRVSPISSNNQSQTNSLSERNNSRDFENISEILDEKHRHFEENRQSQFTREKLKGGEVCGFTDTLMRAQYDGIDAILGRKISTADSVWEQWEFGDSEHPFNDCYVERDKVVNRDVYHVNCTRPINANYDEQKVFADKIFDGLDSCFAGVQAQIIESSEIRESMAFERRSVIIEPSGGPEIYITHSFTAHYETPMFENKFEATIFVDD